MAMASSLSCVPYYYGDDIIVVLLFLIPTAMTSSLSCVPYYYGDDIIVVLLFPIPMTSSLFVPCSGPSMNNVWRNWRVTSGECHAPGLVRHLSLCTESTCSGRTATYIVLTDSVSPLPAPTSNLWPKCRGSMRNSRRKSGTYPSFPPPTFLTAHSVHVHLSIVRLCS